VGPKDKVLFTSNDPNTAIRLGPTTPFAELEVGPNTVLRIGNDNEKGPFEKGPFQVVKPDGPVPPGHRTHKFACGFKNPADGGNFAPWGGTDGDDIPVDP
jgi:hypothetical protein